MLALHLLQSSLVYINTLLLQRVLDDPVWAKRLTPEDRRALSALFWTHVNPLGRYAITATQPRTGLRPLRDPSVAHDD